MHRGAACPRGEAASCAGEQHAPGGGSIMRRRSSMPWGGRQHHAQGEQHAKGGQHAEREQCVQGEQHAGGSSITVLYIASFHEIEENFFLASNLRNNST